MTCLTAALMHRNAEAVLLRLTVVLRRLIWGLCFWGRDLLRVRRRGLGLYTFQRSLVLRAQQCLRLLGTYMSARQDSSQGCSRTRSLTASSKSSPTAPLLQPATIASLRQPSLAASVLVSPPRPPPTVYSYSIPHTGSLPGPPFYNLQGILFSSSIPPTASCSIPTQESSSCSFLEPRPAGIHYSLGGDWLCNP